MKVVLATLLIFLPASLVARAEQLIPAGSVMQCMVSEPNLSSKTAHIGDPVLCQVSHSEMYGRSVFPYGSYMVGRFEDYRDPGHFVGKGWMELKFDRMIVGNDTVIPISTRVVATSAKYPVDRDGRIPTKSEVQHQPEPISRYNYADLESRQQSAPIERVQPASAPIERSYAQLAPIQQAYAQPNPTVVVVQSPAPAPVVQQPPVIYAYPPGPYGYPPPPPMGYGYPPVAYGYYYRPY
jgi:hypothetical protein